MGCAPSSSGTISSKESIQLIQEIEELKKHQETKEEEIKKLRSENAFLRESAGIVEEENVRLDTSLEVEQLSKELEALKLENSNLRKELMTMGSPSKVVPQNRSPVKGLQKESKNLPKVGDHVLAMWSVSMWQYFTATIVSFDPNTLKFTIEWDDQDPSGRVIDYYNLALDRVPDDDEIAVGSIVLFPQGAYKGKEGVRLGGQRWHQGRITDVTHGPDGEKLYDGEHTKGKNDGKWVTYKGYDPKFDDLKRHQLRIAPNVLDLLSAEEESDPPSRAGDVINPCDVFISYAKANSVNAVRNKEIPDLPPTYEEAVAHLCDPRDIRQELLQKGIQVNKEDNHSNLMDTVKMINSAKVFVAFLSDEYASDEICRQEFQYAKKTAKKPVVPVVIGNSFDWMMSVVGLLIAGELYIHFKDKSIQDVKMQELLKAVKRSVKVDEPDAASIQTVSALPPVLETADVFVSYCWWNSNTAYQAKQISSLIGNQYSDPRKIKEDLSKMLNLVIWLDTERLQTNNQSDSSMGMFEQIAKGLARAKVIIVFVSEEYAASDNCRMEFQFALKSLRKPIVPVIVGTGQKWQQTVVGLLVTSQNTEPVSMHGISSDEGYRGALDKIGDHVKSLLGLKEQETTYKAPVIGDHVVCHHQQWAYYYATVVTFNRETMEYTVDWDDGDPSGRVQSYNYVGKDEVPTPDQIGVDSIVFFPQGSYAGTVGNNAGGGRFHEGIITNVRKDASGVTVYDGHHTKGEEDGKWVTYKGYSYEFFDMKLEDLRIAPNAMDALMACKQVFNVDT
ncbi:uncharacterized protein LOC116604300 [Nematostella vectensis]|uniref:uncharacterized protein LOC116604300 n=1 Tax=Nematostella vectensis TaxID=45351 RepID=UPI0020773205|nr:uncharacterized protein LOC116604300 [Nematostella vectensis]XP_048580169.1 uncharacterized protein LOC116604300 [Nematostella vectensis]